MLFFNENLYSRSRLPAQVGRPNCFLGGPDDTKELHEPVPLPLLPDPLDQGRRLRRLRGNTQREQGAGEVLVFVLDTHTTNQ